MKKIILLTGDSGFLGSHLRTSLLAKGAIVCGVDFANTPDFSHDNYFNYTGDITDVSFVAELQNQIKLRFGRLDCIINNAAINDSLENKSVDVQQSKFENFSLDLWQKTLSVNLTGPFLLCQGLLELLKNSDNSAIINISSTYGMVAPKQDLYIDETGKQMFYKGPAYSVSKAGLIMFTKYLAAYLGQYGIRVNSVSPGGIENGQDLHFVDKYASRTLLNRMAQPTDYNGIIEFLISEQSLYLTGANIPVDGGWTAT